LNAKPKLRQPKSTTQTPFSASYWRRNVVKMNHFRQKGHERMMEEWAAGVIESLWGRRDLDLAEGILIGLRRCGPNAAYHELLGAAKRQSVGLMAISSALVELASNQDPSTSHLEGPAHSAAYCEWHDLFDQRRRQTPDARACDETGNGAGK
jgi:hypothetical protein